MNKNSISFFKNNNKKKYINYNKTEIIDNYLFSVPSKYQTKINSEREKLKKFINLLDLTKEKDEIYISEIKEKLQKHFISFLNKKNVTDITDIFFISPFRFGNTLVTLNNLIYYCEILGFKNIYLDKDNIQFLKNKIIGDKVNISITSKKDIDCKSTHIACFKQNSPYANFFFFQEYVKPQIRLNLIKNEIKNNLPQVEINKNDLIIHIRSGDIFNSGYEGYYAQPPLCFFQNVINKFNSSKIFIISENKNNPVLTKILEEFPDIIYNQQNLPVDFAYLINAYNLVASVSTFLTTAVILNSNLIKFFEYDICRNSQKFLHLHNDFYYFPRKFTIYKMKPSTTYKNEMFVFKAEQNYFNLMIGEKCIYDFTVIEQNN